MVNVYNGETTARIIWDILRGEGRDVDSTSFAVALKILYYRHKGYSIDNNIVLPDETTQDSLVSLFNCYVVLGTKIDQLTTFITDIPDEQFKSIYSEILLELMTLNAINNPRGAELTPKEINQLLSYLVSSFGCNSVYDPFCGSAGIVNYLPNGCAFTGQEVNQLAFLEAGLTTELNKGRIKTSLSSKDSISHWSEESYDALVSCPPFSAFLENTAEQNVAQETHVRCSFVEDLPIVRGLSVNNAKAVITLLPYTFCFGNAHKDLRRFLVNNNYIDTVISLPANLLYGTNIKTIVLVCHKHREEEAPVKFFFVEDFTIGNRIRDKKLDVERLITGMKTMSGLKYNQVSREEIKGNDYSFIPALYLPVDLTGDRVVKLSELINPISSSRATKPDTPILDSDIMSNNAIGAILNANRTSEKNTTPNNLRFFDCAKEDKCLIDISLGASQRYGLYTSGGAFLCSRILKAFTINTELVDPEYLVIALFKNEALKLSGSNLTTMLDLKLTIDPKPKQVEIVKRLKDEYLENRDRESAADRERLGKKTVQSEIEHMLGRTQQRIGRLLSLLNKSMPSEVEYYKYMKRLKDNFDYMERLIHFTNMPLESFNLTQGNLGAFIEDYVAAWNNYGPGYFDVDIENHLEGMEEIAIDKTLLTVMLDSILDNAGRHSFEKRKCAENKVVISLDCVNESGNSYIVISIANNGKPFAEGFTIDDYISRGRYSAISGRSGLGGYHVYQVTKGHKGLLSISSNAEWNVIIDILIPEGSINPELLPVYGKEYR